MTKPFQNGHFVELAFYSKDDAAAVSTWFYDFDYRFFFRDFSFLVKIEDFPKLGENLARQGISLVTIKDKKTGNPVGLLTFGLEKPAAKIYKFGIMLDNKLQHKVFAVDALIVMGNYLFHQKDAFKVSLEFCAEDKHIKRITDKGGFTHDATLKDEVFVDGKRYDEERYSMTKEVYVKLYGEYL